MLSQGIILGWHTVANASSLRSELVCVVQRKGVKKIVPEDPPLWDINEMLDHSQPPRSQYPSREVLLLLILMCVWQAGGRGEDRGQSYLSAILRSLRIFGLGQP